MPVVNARVAPASSLRRGTQRVVCQASATTAKQASAPGTAHSNGAGTKVMIVGKIIGPID